MSLKRFLLSVAAAGTLGLGAYSAQAATICSGCDYVDGSPATFLGVHDATTNDLSTFQHIFTAISTAFTDYWVFDIAPAADSSASADFTALAAIAGFTGDLFTAGAGTACGGGPGSGCAALVLGALVVADSDPSTDRFELIASLAPGQYVIRVTGTTNADGDSAYTGQVNFEANRQVPEPGTLALLALGLIGVAGLGVRKGR